MCVCRIMLQKKKGLRARKLDSTTQKKRHNGIIIYCGKNDGLKSAVKKRRITTVEKKGEQKNIGHQYTCCISLCHVEFVFVVT